MNKEQLEKLTNENIKPLEHGVFDQLESLMRDTLLTNEKFNVTAITDEDKFRELMLYDSLTVLKYVSFAGKNVLDVGTGAGYPGLPLMIASDGNFTLLDSTKKKVDHINEYIKENELKNGSAVCFRVEDYAKENGETFDYVIARAVASLNILLELCMPLLKVGGVFIAMKGAKAEEEIELSKNAFKKLDAEIIELVKFNLPISKEERNIILIRKNKKTNKRYPRSYSEIKKQPL